MTCVDRCVQLDVVFHELFDGEFELVVLGFRIKLTGEVFDPGLRCEVRFQFGKQSAVERLELQLTCTVRSGVTESCNYTERYRKLQSDRVSQTETDSEIESETNIDRQNVR